MKRSLGANSRPLGINDCSSPREACYRDQIATILASTAACRVSYEDSTNPTRVKCIKSPRKTATSNAPLEQDVIGSLP